MKPYEMTRTIDARTEAEKARDARHRSICNGYNEITEREPGLSAHRIFGVLAKQNGMTIPGIRRVLVKSGLYAPKHVQP